MVASTDDSNETDLSMGDISSGIAAPDRASRDGRYTIAEAAQIKGVSYHTVSRAIRRGRLPVQRLGRMALIAEEDLIAWRPMRERAPRKYRQVEASETPPAQLDTAQAQPVDLATRLSSYYEEIHLHAAESSLSEFATHVCDRFAEAVGLSRVAFWLIDESANVATCVGTHGSEFEPFPWRFALSDIPFVLTFARQGQTRLVLDLAAELQGGADRLATGEVESMLAAPLRLRSRAIGLICGDRGGLPIVLTQEHLALAHRLANQIALAVEYNRSLRAEARQAFQLSAVMEEVDAAVCACDAMGRMTILNARHRALAGYSDAEADAIIGMHARDYLSQNAGHRYHLDGTPFPIDEHPLLRAIAGETVTRVEYKIVREGQEPVYIVASGRPMIVDGEFLGAVSTGREQSHEWREIQEERLLAEKSQMEWQRAESLHALAAALLGATRASEIYDLTLGDLVRTLRADFASFYRTERGGKIRLVGRLGIEMPAGADLVYDLIALPSTATALASGIPSILHENQTMLLENRIQRDTQAATSLIVPLHSRESPHGVLYVNYRQKTELLVADYEYATAVAGLVERAVERFDAFQELQASHDRLLAVIDQLPQAMLVISYPAGEVLVANRAAEAMWGMPLRDRVLVESLPLIDIEGVRPRREDHPMLRSMQTGSSHLGEPLSVERSDGTVLDVIANHTPIIDANGLIQGSVSVLQERSTFKPLDRAKDEFLSVVAHEIRNPLTSLRGNLQLLERRVRKSAREDTEAEVRRIRSVIDQVDRIAELVSRMLDISRADLGKLDLSLEETDASLLVQSVVSEVLGSSPQQEIIVTAPERLPVVWDEVRVQQILVNLTTNAMRYAPDGPIEVDVRTQPDDQVQISVRDHGNGVPPRIRKRLFNQYYRFDDGQDDREIAFDGSRGLGIGLYISARLAREHGGRLEVADADGGGAIFTLTLPRTAIPARPAQDEPAARSVSS